MSADDRNTLRNVITFATWAEQLPDTPFEMRIVGRNDEYRLRASISGMPGTEGFPECTDAFGSNITDLATINDLDDFYVQGRVIEATVSGPEAYALSQIRQHFGDGYEILHSVGA
ncbi:hypothetical protein G6L37_04845 [Agrobacterium rubi]|nr:hypothetical protein [Agrobacterium rubi]NTF24682.1 hypothetical protein [Agrobacterium rubi]